MNKLELVPVLLRERLSSRVLLREPEPDLIMDDAAQVAAYDEAGSIDGLMAASYLFHSARISQVIQGCQTVVDLGCGPAIQLCQIADLNRSTKFLGVDLSQTMLEKARANAERLRLTNIDFRLGDITNLASLNAKSTDAVISTMALHHLPTTDHLRACFREINRILRNNGALYLVDFGRLKLAETLLFFVRQNSDQQPKLFTLDYERSLRAAFADSDFKAIALQELPKHVHVFTTFMVPMLVVLKSDDKPMPEELRQRLRRFVTALKPRYRGDLDDMRMFFRLGGFSNDPFR